MQCPKCKEEINNNLIYDLVGNNTEVANDGSFITAEFNCPLCGTEISAYYSFHDIQVVE